jgi:hypothetical protein
MGYFLNFATIFLVFSLGSCDSSFDGGNGGAEFRAGNKQQISKPKADANSDAKASPCDPGNGDCLHVDQAGEVVINRSVTGFLFSGNGPGSCGLDPMCGKGSQACPAGYSQIADSTSGRLLFMGDCFIDPSTRRARCFANRQLCRQTAVDADSGSLDFQFFSGDGCPAGWEAAGPVGGKFHLFGQVNGSYYSQVAACKKSIPKGEIRPGTRLVTDVKLFGVGERFPTAPACPSGYEQAGLMLDCVNTAGITPVGAPACSGQTRICKKFEVVP